MTDNKWYNHLGEWGDIVVSSRIRLARNIKEYPFPSRLSPENRKAIAQQIRDALLLTEIPITKTLGYFEPDSLSVDAKRAMAERHLISREFAECGRNRPMMLSSDEAIRILLCDQDHIRLQVMSAGLELNNAYEIVNQLDDIIGGQFAYAFDEKWGYLTACPTDLGTGMKASVLLHLPALEATDGIQTLAKAVGKIGLRLQGTFGEGSHITGSLYQLSNQISMGIDETSALDNLRSVTLQVIAREQDARKELDPLKTEDTVFRSLGLLRNARILTVKEFSSALSHVRLGVSMGLIPGISIETINALNMQMHPATLLLENPQADSTEKRDVIRSTKIRQQLE